MGWWNAGADGRSFAEDRDVIGLWGDPAADILSQAVDEIVAEFESQWGRKPSNNELLAGMRFCLGGLELADASPEEVLARILSE